MKKCWKLRNSRLASLRRCAAQSSSLLKDGQLDDSGGKRAVAGHLADCNAVRCLPVHHRPDRFGDRVDDHDDDGYCAEYCAEGTDRDSDIRQHSFPDPWTDGHGIHLRHCIENKMAELIADQQASGTKITDEMMNQLINPLTAVDMAPELLPTVRGNPLCGYPQRLLIWFAYRIIVDGHRRLRQKAKGKLKDWTHPSGWGGLF